MNSKRKNVYIIGAGPVGLVSGWKLAENGWNVNIFERGESVGGMCRSWSWNDYILDVGPHIFHTPDESLRELWLSEFGDLLQSGEYYSMNVKGSLYDEFHHYPVSWEGVSQLSEEIKKSIVNDFNNLKASDKANASTYFEYMDAQVGPTLRKLYYEKYPQKIWGIDPRDLTADWAPKRIKFRDKISPFYQNEWVGVGKKGTGAIYERIADYISRDGGKIHLEKTLIGVETNGNSLTRLTFSNGDLIDIEPDDIVISSVPLTILASFFGYKSELKFRGVRLCYVAIDREKVIQKNASWLYYDDLNVIFNRITEPKTMMSDVCPPGKTLLVAEVAYSKGDDIDRLSASDFEERVISDLVKVKLIKRSEFDGVCSHSEPYVYPVQYKGYQEELARTRSVITKFSQLYSLGTGGDFNYADSQILFHMAFDTVDILCGKDSKHAQTIRQTRSIKPNKIVEVGSFSIGDDYPPLIIAEAGMNHNGSLDLAKKLIDEAESCKCSFVKFQSFKKGSRVSSKVKGARYAEKADGLQEDISEMFDRLSMSYEDQRELFSYAHKKNIEVFSTPFDIESVDFLHEVGVSVFKIASMDIVNLPLIRYVASKGKPIVLSTGMSNLSLIEDAVNTILSEGNPNIILLHCNSSYPSPEADMNLNAIKSMKAAFNLPVGLSDHTIGLFASHTAMALGANIIERHFTLSRTMEGPDHILSSDPIEMAELVTISKRLPVIMGDGRKEIKGSEYSTLNQQRKCLYAAKTILEGEIITQDMIIIKGPGGGILPKFLDIIIGRAARAKIEVDNPITWAKV